MATKTSWRDFIKVHPAADLFPMMGQDELRALGEDIERNGLKFPIDLFSAKLGEEYLVLDGRNRLDAMELIGWHFEYDKNRERSKLKAIDPSGVERSDIWGIPNLKSHEAEVSQRDPVHFDPYAHVVSVNIRRRHLTTAQKGELIEALLRANPERSDRATAKIAHVDHKTVAAKRDKLEQGGEIPHHETRVGKDGVTQPAEKSKSIATPTKPATVPPPIVMPYLAEQPPAPAPTPTAPTATTAPPPIVPQPLGVKVDDELLKWTAAFRSWPWHRQEMALSLIEVDEDSVAALKEDHDLLELKELHIIALKEDISRLEQENRSLRECLASQLDPKPEPDQHHEPEGAEPVLADAVNEPKPAAPEVIEQEQREREPDPAQSLSELDQVALLIFQERAAKTPCPWIGVAGREKLGIDEDAIDRLAAAGFIVPSPGNPHAYGIPVGDPRRREDEDVKEATPPSMAA